MEELKKVNREEEMKKAEFERKMATLDKKQEYIKKTYDWKTAVKSAGEE